MTEQIHTLPAIVRAKEMPTVCGIGPSTAWEWARDPDNDFPSPRKLGPQMTGWLRSELDAWLARQEPIYQKNIEADAIGDDAA